MWYINDRVEMNFLNPGAPIKCPCFQSHWRLSHTQITGAGELSWPRKKMFVDVWFQPINLGSKGSWKFTVSSRCPFFNNYYDTTCWGRAVGGSEPVGKPLSTAVGCFPPNTCLYATGYCPACGGSLCRIISPPSLSRHITIMMQKHFTESTKFGFKREKKRNGCVLSVWTFPDFNTFIKA